jgi:hypothetical protein
MRAEQSSTHPSAAAPLAHLDHEEPCFEVALDLFRCFEQREKQLAFGWFHGSLTWVLLEDARRPARPSAPRLVRMNHGGPRGPSLEVALGQQQQRELVLPLSLRTHERECSTWLEVRRPEAAARRRQKELSCTT